MSQPEARIAAAIIQYLRGLPDAYARKVHGSQFGTVGEPDVDACVAGRSVKLEVKRPETRSSVTAMQRRALDRWAKAGALVGVVTSVEEAADLLRGEGLVP